MSKTTVEGGFIYVLTNPSFPEYVKIGYADNVDERVAQLNRTECTPFAFRKYAVLHVASRLADKKVHNLIDKFKPELRAKENVNGKMRVREFFAMSAREAVEILGDIGSIYGETPQIFEQTTTEREEQELADEVALASERKSPFSFYKCGIRKGEIVEFAHDATVVCTVAGDREILYNGKKTSLSALAKQLLSRKSGVQGTLYFTYKGEVLSALRKRLEDEGRYNSEEDKSALTAESQTPNTQKNEYILLFFVSNKLHATCKIVDGGFLLLSGSEVAPTCSPDCARWIKKLRSTHEDNLRDNRLIGDILFDSSSAAAAFVAGNSRNGKVCWRTADGTPLKDLPVGNEK